MNMLGRVLIVAGSDSGGGAGIQADVKTVSMLGGYAATAITAITIQDTLGVHGVHPIPAEIVADQMRVVLRDIGADAIKTGMLGDAHLIETVADVLASDGKSIPLVLDPVMVAKGGAKLLADEAVAALMTRLLPLAHVITPNAPELAVLTGMRTDTHEAMANAARALFERHGVPVLAKGGHVSGETITDLLLSDGNEAVFEASRLDTPHTHGTGCTLASAIATGLAQGMALTDAVGRAHDYVQNAIRTAPGYGKGHGPLNHGHVLDRG